MKNKITFYLILIITAQSSNCSGPSWEDIANGSNCSYPSWPDAVKDSSNRSPLISQNFGMAGVFGAVIYTAGAPLIIPAAIGAGLGICIFAGQEVYKNYNPTPEEIAAAEKRKALAMEIHKKREILVAEAAFKSCLMNNNNSAKNENDIPCACSEQFHTFAEAAGHAQAEETVKTFNKYSSQGA
ncbi:MAG: hypothetical protein P4L31_00125 [Candidatus Babeliales bacterium]|nr:hypothetical protein [Candidatus Babeliales bacterium]